MFVDQFRVEAVGVEGKLLYRTHFSHDLRSLDLHVVLGVKRVVRVDCVSGSFSQVAEVLDVRLAVAVFVLDSGEVLLTMGDEFETVLEAA